jgi:uncharacterized protein with ParB-like and HNH nuclease domain
VSSLFNVYELQEELDVFVVFETMNNRGKPLSKLELLKNRLIYLSTLLPDSTKEQDRDALRRNINDAWKTVYEFLGREKDYPLDDDDFLRAHWIMYFTYARDEAGKFASFLLDNHFTADRAGSGKLPINELQRYVTQRAKLRTGVARDPLPRAGKWANGRGSARLRTARPTRTRSIRTADHGRQAKGCGELRV